MSYTTVSKRDSNKPVLHDYHPAPARFQEDILVGLRKPQRQIPPKYFYDEVGSQLFDVICQLPEYYPTRTEIELLEKYGEEIAQCMGVNDILVEFGSGSSLKIRLLLDNLQPDAYLPIDISKAHLFKSAKILAKDYPQVAIHAICADYTHPLILPKNFKEGVKSGFFPGSSIGNFEPKEALQFLKQIALLLGKGSGLLIGVDLKKDADILNAAYNDSQGITAAFNLNLLKRINRELQGNFDLDSFKHNAFYNDSKGRVEMHLVSQKKQTVSIGEYIFEFQAGETMHTESSYKYSVDDFQKLAQAAGFYPKQVWVGEEALFSVHYLCL
ncbi:L-histidine N(alpha)-methyltransferase [Candidatus Nitrosacidococcus tergens]|uniref:Histidine-specific methyltransferase EgtD n=1 Tax=Candidatus Nitrosacidococcus tergens TaxID=553981 RepID=A0A7G1Q8R8_9GAMM|nr:L-histidine N(alpha)-methyltransferase [Candidatus Nitrosacidococcus tergens]CAB1274946.1 Histidine-specific methyltransferase EgtD [Candidatus Nitrosacidococcus tergens]